MIILFVVFYVMIIEKKEIFFVGVDRENCLNFLIKWGCFVVDGENMLFYNFIDRRLKNDKLRKIV